MEHRTVTDIWFNVLIAEDDDEDQELLKLVFAEVMPTIKITFSSNGQELLEMLRSTSDEALPVLIVMDYNMPVLNGLETLKLLEIDQRLNHIPKIVYSTANNNHYKIQRYSAHASAYIEKGTSIYELRENVLQMMSFVGAYLSREKRNFLSSKKK